jgi:hypothetical protein
MLRLFMSTYLAVEDSNRFVWLDDNYSVSRHITNNGTRSRTTDDFSNISVAEDFTNQGTACCTNPGIFSDRTA